MSKDVTPLAAHVAGPAVALVAASVVSNVLMLTGPLFMLQVYDRVLASRSVPTLVVLTMLIAGLFAFYAFLDALRARMSARFANILGHRISPGLMAAGVRMRLVSNAPKHFDPVRDGETVRQFLGGTAPLTLLDLPWVPIYLGLVFLFHPWLGWLAVAGASIIVILMIFNEMLSRKPSQEVSVLQLLRQRQADDFRLNAEIVVAMGMFERMYERWAEHTARLFAAQTRAGDRSSFFSAATKGLRFFLQSAVLALGAYLVIQGTMSPGLMIAASVITARALAPIEQIVGQWRSFVGARQAWSRIKKILAIPQEQLRQVKLPLPRKSLVVKGLTCAPQGSRAVLVSGITFNLAAGEAVGVLGASGAGKSSLAKGILGILSATAGEVRFDGALLSHYRTEQIGRICGYLPQRVDLLDGTVAENISRFATNADSQEVIAAAIAADAHELINALPDGYNTQVGEQGDLLSAGQRQRVGLARALFGSPFLVVLDEPNSNLDADGDAALSTAIRVARQRGAVVLVIAHRPSALTSVDKVLFLQNGRQIAFGPKEEVLKKVTIPGNVLPLKVPAQ